MISKHPVATYNNPKNRPTKAVASVFGSEATPTLLEGGGGATYRAGNIILKSIDNELEADWIGQVFAELPEQTEVRIQRPIKSARGNWIEKGYVAWTFLEGTTVQGSYPAKLDACDAFHRAVRHIAKPDFLESRQDSWSLADRVAWQERPPSYDVAFMAFIDPLISQLVPLDLPSQLIHGDLSGNFVSDDASPPGIIDITPYWRPVGYAKATILVDTVWDKEHLTDIAVFRDIPHIRQLTLRALVRRMAEQPEHLEYFGKTRKGALATVQRYSKAGERLLNLTDACCR